MFVRVNPVSRIGSSYDRLSFFLSCFCFLHPSGALKYHFAGF